MVWQQVDDERAPAYNVIHIRIPCEPILSPYPIQRSHNPDVRIANYYHYYASIFISWKWSSCSMSVSLRIWWKTVYFWYTLVPTNSIVPAKTVYIGSISEFFFFWLVLIIRSEWKHLQSVPPSKPIPNWFNVNFQLERYFGKSIKIKLIRLLTSNKVYSFELCGKLNGAMSSILWRMITACFLICIKRLAIKWYWSMIIDCWLARLRHKI